LINAGVNASLNDCRSSKRKVVKKVVNPAANRFPLRSWLGSEPRSGPRRCPRPRSRSVERAQSWPRWKASCRLRASMPWSTQSRRAPLEIRACDDRKTSKCCALTAGHSEDRVLPAGW